MNIGKTRRSASSAKPVRGAGEDSKTTKTPKSKKGRYVPPYLTPEFRRWRKLWFAALAAAVAFSGFAWWQQNTIHGTIVLVLAYVCIVGAFYLDFGKMRPMRKAALEASKADKSPKDQADSSSSDKKK